MSTLTKEWLQQTIAELEEERDATPGAVNEDVAMALTAMKIALASLEAEPLGYIDAEYAELLKSGHIESCSVYAEQGEGCITLYIAPPAPVSVPDEDLLHMAASAIEDLLSSKDRSGALVWADVPARLRRAAMLQGADNEIQRKSEIHDALCAKYNVESLADFVDWQRNHIAELEAAPPAPVGPDETAVMPDYPGYVMTQRECFQAGKKAGMAELVTTAYKLRDAVEIIRNSGIEIDAEKIFAERDALNTPDCWCRTCRPVTVTDMRFVVCPECGNKRCPHANDHRNACTGSNEPGQEGGEYPAAPQQEVK